MASNKEKITLYWDKEFKQSAKNYLAGSGESLSVLTERLTRQHMSGSMSVTLDLPVEVVNLVQDKADKHGVDLRSALQTVIINLLKEEE